jgi:hypothetical protein
LPETLTKVYSRAFAYAPAVNIDSTNKLSYIGDRAFWESGKNITQFTLQSSIQTINDKAFLDFGATNGLTVINETTILSDDMVWDYFGSNLTTVTGKEG